MKSGHNKGFTLLEVMIVVAIIGIIASVAYASYTNQVMRTNRSDAIAMLNDASQRLQRCYTTYSRYDSDDCAAFSTYEAGVESSEGYYEVELTASTAATYTLTATPIRSPQTNDTNCPTLTLNHAGVRSPEDCW